MKIVTLIENTTCREELACEHGLSLYIEVNGRKLLFDAGQSGAFADNAERLGVDLTAVDTAVLSHGHYDHGGGLPRFLEINDAAKIYVNRFAFEPHYNAQGKDIGLALQLQKSSRLVFTRGLTHLGDGLALHTLLCPPADTSGLTVLEEGLLCPEDFRHEQYLLAEEAGKRILISGCSHKGILNILDHFRPDILVGGFHFMKIEAEAALQAAAEALLQYPTTYYTGHCTGEKQFAYLKNRMGERLHSLSTGSTIELLQPGL
ncbi:MAG: MBL fold metallo-hydrolase [Oscillospiraceae bacterium]|nr:MBL fold metallo-hydrolase [Oscillospiraceae bacterium]